MLILTHNIPPLHAGHIQLITSVSVLVSPLSNLIETGCDPMYALQIGQESNSLSM